MEVRFHKRVRYKCRVGDPIVLVVCRRSGKSAIVEVESSETTYPVLLKKSIQVTEDGREFIDIKVDSHSYCRVWATDAER